MGVVGGIVSLATDSISSRSEPDAPWFAVTALGTDTVTLSVTPGAALSAGDEVLLINLQGTSSAISNVGQYEFLYVNYVAEDVVHLFTNITKTFSEVDNTDLSGQIVMLVRVPHYTNLTVAADGMLTTDPFDGTGGGVLAFRVSGNLTVDPGGSVDLSFMGYRGGPTGSAYNIDAFQGESRTGLGQGACTGYNESCGYWAANDGAGGAHITGGGGNYGGGATAGDSWNGGGDTPPEAGSVYGIANLTELYFGSGGGGVWNGNTIGVGPGPGGAGGGILFISATAMVVDADALLCQGETSLHAAQGIYTYGAAGGAGGSIWIRAQTLNTSGLAGYAEGGLGQTTTIRAGGLGGVGRIRVDYQTINGQPFGSGGDVTELQTAFDPNPGFSALAP